MNLTMLTDEQANEMFPPPKSVGKSAEQEQIDELKESMNELLEVIRNAISLMGGNAADVSAISSISDLTKKSEVKGCSDEHTGN